VRESARERSSVTLQVFQPCAVIPTYDNPATVRAVVEAVRAHVADVVVVDDGSGAAGRAAVDAITRSGLAHLERHARNAGKGAAVKSGFTAAQRLGATHVLQVDADGQHDLGDVPRFLAEARAHPDALILGRPVFDATQPRSRAFARQLSIFWVSVETGGRAIADPQCGFPVYPLAAPLAPPPRRAARRGRVGLSHGVRSRVAGANGVGRHAGPKYPDARAVPLRGRGRRLPLRRAARHRAHLVAPRAPGARRRGPRPVLHPQG